MRLTIAWPAVSLVVALLAAAACGGEDPSSPTGSSGASGSSGGSSGSSGGSSGSSGGSSGSSSGAIGGDGGSDAGASSGASGDAGLPAYTVETYRGLRLIRSVTVHKNGGEDRVVYVEESKVGALPSSGPLPDGARFVMLVNGGGNFVIEKVAGAWQYGNLNTSTTPATFPTNASCSGCHNGAAEPGMFTLPSLRRLLKTHKGEEINCPKGPGPTPCDAAVYQ